MECREQNNDKMVRRRIRKWARRGGAEGDAAARVREK